MSLKLTGTYNITHRDKKGNILNQRTSTNTITNTGKIAISKLINGVVPCTSFTYLQIGEGTTTPTTSDTTLETFNAEAAASCTYESLYKAKLAYTFTPAGRPVDITEYGVFDGASAGSPDMLSRIVETAESVGVGETLEVEYTIAVE